MSDYVRGIMTTAFDSYGLIQSLSSSGEAQEDQARDKDGATAYFETFDPTVNMTATVRFDRNATLPKAGEIVSISDRPNSDEDGEYKVLQPPAAEETNEAGPSVTIELRRYLENGIPSSET